MNDPFVVAVYDLLISASNSHSEILSTLNQDQGKSHSLLGTNVEPFFSSGILSTLPSAAMQFVSLEAILQSTRVFSNFTDNEMLVAFVDKHRQQPQLQASNRNEMALFKLLHFGGFTEQSSSPDRLRCSYSFIREMPAVVDMITKVDKVLAFYRQYPVTLCTVRRWVSDLLRLPSTCSILSTMLTTITIAVEEEDAKSPLLQLVIQYEEEETRLSDPLYDVIIF